VVLVVVVSLPAQVDGGFIATFVSAGLFANILSTLSYLPLTWPSAREVLHDDCANYTAQLRTQLEEAKRRIDWEYQQRAELEHLVQVSQDLAERSAIAAQAAKDLAERQDFALRFGAFVSFGLICLVGYCFWLQERVCDKFRAQLSASRLKQEKLEEELAHASARDQDFEGLRQSVEESNALVVAWVQEIEESLMADRDHLFQWFSKSEATMQVVLAKLDELTREPRAERQRGSQAGRQVGGCDGSGPECTMRTAPRWRPASTM